MWEVFQSSSVFSHLRQVPCVLVSLSLQLLKCEQQGQWENQGQCGVELLEWALSAHALIAPLAGVHLAVDLKGSGKLKWASPSNHC